MKKTAAILGSLLLMGGLAGCSTSSNGAASSLPDAKIKVDQNVPSWQKDKNSANLNWYLNFDWFTPGKIDNVASRFIAEDTHTNITYQSGGDDKLNTLLASGDLPDIITVDGSTSIAKDISKVAIPLDELAKKYDPYFLNKAAKKDTLKFFTQSDGHIYGYPNFSTTKQDYAMGGLYGNEAFMVRKDIYEKLGKPDMSTPEGFLSALAAVQKLNMKDKLGKPIIPFGTNDISNAYIGVDNTLADFIGVPNVTKDGKYYDRFTDPDFQKWLKVLSEARRDGYTDPDMLTMSGDDKNARLTNGSYFVYFATNLNAEPDPMTEWYNHNPGKDYIAVNGPASTIGRKIALSGPSIQGWTETFISKKAKNPEKAMELITYFVSPQGDTIQNYGRLGQTYTMVDGKPVLNKNLLDMKLKDPTGFEKKIGLGSFIWLNDSALTSRQMGITQFPNSLQQPKEWTRDKIVAPDEIANINTNLTQAAARNKTKIKQNWAQTFTKIMNAKSDAEIDQAMKNYVQYRNDNGWSDIVAQYNKTIQSNIEKLK